MNKDEQAAREIVRARTHGLCEVAVPEVCRGTHESTHHRRKVRHDDGGWKASNLLGVCGDGTTGCHGWIEAHPAKAAEYGWWVRSECDPATTPVFLRWYGERSWWILDDEGTLHFQGEGEAEPDTGADAP